MGRIFPKGSVIAKFLKEELWQVPGMHREPVGRI